MTLNGVEVWFYYDASGTPYAVKFQDAYYYYTTNAQGDVTAILDSSGNRIGTYTYDAWGKPITTTAHHALTIVNPLRYRGYVYDFETELYYLQSRYYNPEVGRFLNADGYWATGQGILGNNMFAYCNNNPVNCCDPEGCSPGAVALGFLIFAVCVTMSGCAQYEEDDNPEPYSGEANCYAYALQLENDPRTGLPFRSKPQPGEFSGSAYFGGFDIYGKTSEEIRNYILGKVAKDADVLGYVFYEVNEPNYTTTSGQWLIALRWSTKKKNYHWWRRDEIGSWTHKPGNTDISGVDGLGAPITDPMVGDAGIYNEFWGYFVVGPK